MHLQPTDGRTTLVRLTDLGRSFWMPVQEISNWVLRHQGDIDTARIRFDTQDSEIFEPA